MSTEEYHFTDNELEEKYHPISQEQLADEERRFKEMKESGELENMPPIERKALTIDEVKARYIPLFTDEVPAAIHDDEELFREYDAIMLDLPGAVNELSMLVSPIPGTVEFLARNDIWTPWSTIRGNMAMFIVLADNGDIPADPPIMRLSAEMKNINDAIAFAQQHPDGATAAEMKEALPLTLKPIKLADPGKRKKPFSMMELHVWVTINYLKRQDENEAVNRVFRHYYPGYGDLLEATEPTPVEVIPLAQFTPMWKVPTEHDFIMKAVTKGIEAIAYGEKSFILATSEKSKEQITAELVAPEKACAEFIAQHNGNGEIAARALETALHMRRDPNAVEFVKDGIVAVSVNKIYQEMTRTAEGTAKPTRYPKSVATVNAALVAANSAQIFVRDETTGEVANTLKLFPGNLHSDYTYKGVTYKNVWLIPDTGLTPMDYSEVNNHGYAYGLLPGAPLTLEQTGMERWLRDQLNALRVQLYRIGKNGSIQRKRTRNTKPLKRSYYGVNGEPGIFDHFNQKPGRTLTSKQKQNIVSKLDELLKRIAETEVHGQAREGMPMSITAYSERNAAKGRGAGEWVNLVIVATSETRAPKIDLLSGKTPRKKG